MGRYRYAQNKYHGFSQVHVDEHEFTVRFLGVDEKTNELLELYKVTVLNKDAQPHSGPEPPEALVQ